MTKEESLQEIIDKAGMQFDPKIARIFTEIIEEDKVDTKKEGTVDILGKQ